MAIHKTPNIIQVAPKSTDNSVSTFLRSIPYFALQTTCTFSSAYPSHAVLWPRCFLMGVRNLDAKYLHRLKSNHYIQNLSPHPCVHYSHARQIPPFRLHYLFALFSVWMIAHNMWCRRFQDRPGGIEAQLTLVALNGQPMCWQHYAVVCQCEHSSTQSHNQLDSLARFPQNVVNPTPVLLVNIYHLISGGAIITCGSSEFFWRSSVHFCH